MTPRTAATAYLDSVDSPAGAVEFAVDAQGALLVVNMLGGKYPRTAAEDLAILGFVPERDPTRTGNVRQQLEEYFRGERLSFDLPVAFHGSVWQVTVWQALMTIPFGETRTYGQIASQVGRPGAARAAGRANATNRVPIVVPCHRVIGADGSLTGFAAGLELKTYLLEHERAVLERQRRVEPRVSQAALGLQLA